MFDSSRCMLPLTCAACYRDAARFVCAGCGQVRYCNKNCQKKDWKIHRKSCSFYIRASTLDGSEIQVFCQRTENVRSLRKRIESICQTGRRTGVLTQLCQDAMVLEEERKLWTLYHDAVSVVRKRVSESSIPSLTSSSSSD